MVKIFVEEKVWPSMECGQVFILGGFTGEKWTNYQVMLYSILILFLEEFGLQSIQNNQIILLKL